MGDGEAFGKLKRIKKKKFKKHCAPKTKACV